eukprot:5530590-Amphidinium_carterae.1
MRRIAGVMTTSNAYVFDVGRVGIAMCTANKTQTSSSGRKAPFLCLGPRDDWPMAEGFVVAVAIVNLTYVRA